MASTTQSSGDDSKDSLDIAIVGGGIIGAMVALGLLRRGMRVTMYERASDWHEIGAAFAFTGVARECMKQLDPRVMEAFAKVGEENIHPENRFWDGFKPKSKEENESQDSLLLSVSARNLAFWGCLRSHLLHGLAAQLPEGVTKFGKQLESYVDDEKSSRVVLHFADGSVAEADAVIGCDGIRSRTRQILLGQDNPASYAKYIHKVAYRALLPIADGIAALGDDKANNQCAHMGPDAHVLTYPVSNWTLFNVVIFLHDPEPWLDADKMTAPATKEVVTKALKDWSPAVRDVVDRLPQDLIKWGIFDMEDDPAPTYAKGRVCIAGDAAHASSPFHGVGAAMGVEDALVLATTLDTAVAKIRDGTASSKAKAVTAAFEAFSAVRMERSQWLVRSSREMGDIYMWKYEPVGSDAAKCKAEFERRFKIIYDFDVNKMVAEAQNECGQRLKASG